MNRLAGIKKSLLELSELEQLELIRKLREERLTRPERKTPVRKTKTRTAINKNIPTAKKVTNLLNNLSLDEIKELANNLIARAK